MLFAISVSCNPNKPDFQDEPKIEFTGFSKNFVDASDFNTDNDTILVSLSFTDGDGDIGHSDGYTATNKFLADSSKCILGRPGDVVDSTYGVIVYNCNALFTDSRTGCTFFYTIPEIPEKGNVKSISGTIDFILSMFCWNNTQYDTVTFSIRIFDRADHSSNTVTSPPVYIKCF